jgi:hypothetical protein
VSPKRQVQFCTVHPGEASLPFVSWTLRKAVAADLRQIYTAATAHAAEAELERFPVKLPSNCTPIPSLPPWEFRYQELLHLLTGAKQKLQRGSSDPQPDKTTIALENSPSHQRISGRGSRLLAAPVGVRRRLSADMIT